MATRKSRAKKKPTEPTTEDQPQVQPPCAIPGCTNSVFPGEDYCILHSLVNSGVERAKKAFQKGNIWDGLLSGIGAMVVDAGGPMVRPAMAGAAARFATGEQPKRRGPPPSSGKDPWQVLGLDPGAATAEDVKALQRELARLYHPDRCGKAVAAEKLKEINAAATECLKRLKQR